VALEPDAGFAYYDSFVYDLRLVSHHAAPDPTNPARSVGSFIKIALQVNKRPRAD
jgi:hypothetical protein